MLIVVRHALPRTRPDSDPAGWELSATGLDAARELQSLLPVDAFLVSSDEPKAWQTPGGTTAVRRDSRFREVERPVEPWRDDFRAVRRAYVLGAEYAGWEPIGAVAARFDAAIHHYLARAGDHPLVVGSHGMSITAWLVSVGVIARDLAGEFWEGLKLPDAYLVDLDARGIRPLVDGDPA